MNSLLTKDQMISLGVKLIGIIGAALVTKGLVTQDQVSTVQTDLPTLVGAVMTLYTVGYSLWKNRPAKQIADVAKVDGQKVIVPDQKTADQVAKIDPKAAASVVVAQ